MKLKFIIKDSYGNPIASFRDRKSAEEFRLSKNSKCTIDSPLTRQSTEKQKSAVAFCEMCLKNVEFKGDINNFYQCSAFLEQYLEYAKIIYDEACESYYSNFDY